MFDELPPQAIKTGMLYSAAIIKEVAGFLNQARPRPILIVDPVLIATSGARLLKTSALQALREDLLPLADLVTPNLPETEALTGFAVHDPEEMRAAARMLHATYGCPALVKGGHLAGWPEAIDIFWDGTTELMLRGPLLREAKLHGTGCTYGAAVTAYAARGDSIEKAVRHGKDFITTAIHQSVTIGRHRVLKT